MNESGDNDRKEGAGMIGAIAGDMIGSLYERYPIKTRNFQILVSGFTDDTVLTVAVSNSILNDVDFGESMKIFSQKFHHLPYGRSFKRWMWSWENKPYYSCGNGSAMRVSPVGFAFDTVDEVLSVAKRSAEVTHNHPEGIKGAQAVALAIFLARRGESKETIRKEISGRFDYDLDRTLDQIRPNYRSYVDCQRSVPESIIAFLESDSWEDAVKNAISLGGDSDTMACMTGGIAQAYYKKIPGHIISRVLEKLPRDLFAIVEKFNEAHGCAF